jgi:hypothetical protein
MFEGIKTVEIGEGDDKKERYEVHWAGAVETFDTRAEAQASLAKKMAESAGRREAAG